MATKKFNVTVNGTTYEVEVEEVKVAGGAPKAAPAPAPAPKAAPAPAAAPKVAAGAGEHSIDAPMPGKVIKLVAAEGAQNEITADADGTVKKFNVAAGQSVKAHESLVILG